ncbi:MAG: hypothetical protein ACT4PP_07415 [Sporichthyaceae bacterium]
MADSAGEAPDLERRVSTLESEVARLREQVAPTVVDAQAARVLAAGADRDVSEVRAELRAHLGAINALHQTQVEQGRRMDYGFAEMDRGLAEIRTEMRAGMATLVGMIGTLIEDDPA